MASSPVLYPVRRHAPVLVAPAKPTPHEFKSLSDLDDPSYLRVHFLTIHVFPAAGAASSVEGGGGRGDPATVIKDALSKALVFYYPLAGRLRELMPSGKLIVECTGDGVLFIEADADAELEILGNELKPPLPCQEELIYSPEGSEGIVDCPLLLIQVTRFRCGGFIFGLRINHAMVDGTGAAQFINAVAEIARGADAPSVMPVWQRDRLMAMNSGSAIQPLEVDLEEDSSDGVLKVLRRCFFFGPKEMAALWRQVPPHIHRSTTWFELLTAALWRCHMRATATKEDEAEDAVTIFNLLIPVDIRAKLKPPLPSGYYGNAFVSAMAACTMAQLRSNPLSYVVELVKEAKSAIDDESSRSIIRFVAAQRKVISNSFFGRTSFCMSDNSRLGLDKVDFGWGEATYAGLVDFFPGDPNLYLRGRNEKGEDGVVAFICLPSAAMDKFAAQIQIIIK